MCAPTGDGWPKVSKCAVCAPTGDGRPKVSECVECVCVHPHVCSPQLRAWVRVCLVPVDTGGGVCVCVCVCVCMYVYRGVCVCVRTHTPGEHHCETELFWLSFHLV